ncbi:PREDICTED: uncharacterized protein LOC106816820 [Priapulus caudatus]|uniref:Uncharacterized protein LOC106816820 n=1 Tax=Priapulus caudatus TaxID=37621 RepID=A0ABM1EXL7_PRICU|nr:PREDICTED: uncharacterized protein LOC106816820 [Priapulus caudatus]
MHNGEGMERLWSYLRRFNRITKEMTPDHHRVALLDDALLHYSEYLRNQMGETLMHRYIKAQTTGSNCDQELEQLTSSLSVLIYNEHSCRVISTMLRARMSTSPCRLNKLAHASRKPMARLPYELVDAGIIGCEGLPPGVLLKRASNYGHRCLERILVESEKIKFVIFPHGASGAATTSQ